MKAMLRTVTDGNLRYEVLMFVCPGCTAMGAGSGLHMLPVAGDSGAKPRWDFDGNLESPTLNPSILTRYQAGNAPESVCHSYLRNGVFEFLGDCTHTLAGQHAPIPDLPEWVTG